LVDIGGKAEVARTSGLRRHTMTGSATLCIVLRGARSNSGERMLRKVWRSIAVAMIFVLMGPAVSSAYAQQNDWIEYYFLRDANVHCYYSPNSIEWSGSTVRVKSYDSLPIPGSIAVYLREINCSSRTMRTLSIDYLDAKTGALERTESKSETPAEIVSGSINDSLSRRVCN